MYGFDINDSTPYYFPNQLNNPALLYYQLDGEDDSVRYLWSFVGTPTLFMSVMPAEDSENCSESASNLTDWNDFINDQTPGSIHIPYYDEDFAFSLVFNRLIEFKDKKHKASKAFNPKELNDTKICRAVNTSGFDWFFDGNKMQLVAREHNYNASLKDQFSWTIQVRLVNKCYCCCCCCCCLHFHLCFVCAFVYLVVCSSQTWSCQFVSKNIVQ